MGHSVKCFCQNLCWYIIMVFHFIPPVSLDVSLEPTRVTQSGSLSHSFKLEAIGDEQCSCHYLIRN